MTSVFLRLLIKLLVSVCRQIDALISGLIKALEKITAEDPAQPRQDVTQQLSMVSPELANSKTKCSNHIKKIEYFDVRGDFNVPVSDNLT